MCFLKGWYSSIFWITERRKATYTEYIMTNLEHSYGTVTPCWIAQKKNYQSDNKNCDRKLSGDESRPLWCSRLSWSVYGAHKTNNYRTIAEHVQEN